LIYDGHTLKLAEALDEKSRRIFSRSLKLRQVCAAGSGACEADNVQARRLYLVGLVFSLLRRLDMDGLVVTGPVAEYALRAGNIRGNSHQKL
jgi:hypothetical protein